MPGRRTLLTVVAALALLSGCGVVSPWTIATPTPAVVDAAAGARTIRELAAASAQVNAQATRLKLTSTQQKLLDWLVEAGRLQANALDAPEPVTRPTSMVSSASASAGAPSGTPSPSATGSAYPDATSAMTTLSRAYATAAADFRDRAIRGSGTGSLLWTSLAAFATSAASAVTASSTPALATDGNRLVPSVAPGPDANAIMASRTYELIYGFEVTASASTLTAKNKALILARLTAWQRLRDILRDQARIASATPVLPSLAYEIKAPASDADAIKQAGTLDAAGVARLGSWLVSINDAQLRVVAVDALVAAHASSVSMGAPLLRWPGWPPSAERAVPSVEPVSAG